MKEFIDDYMGKLNEVLSNIDRESVEQVKNILFQAWRRDNHIFVMGNGGSASTASHMACDIGKGALSNEYEDNLKRFRIMSLNDNMATVMAFSNDVGYEHVFKEQLKNLVREGDVVIAISASGNSPNVVAALEHANECNATTVGLVGFKGGKVKELSDVTIHVEDDHYGRVEDAHLILNHIFVDSLAEEIKKEKKRRTVH